MERVEYDAPLTVSRLERNRSPLRDKRQKKQKKDADYFQILL